MLVDTHAHLQWRSFNKDIDNVINRAKEADVQSIINVGFDLRSSREAVELATEYKGLHATVGLHPHNASLLTTNTLKEIRKICANHKIVAIGETGLDYYRNLSSKLDQKKAFELQLLLAEELKLPVIIHDREAHADILKTLSKHKGRISGSMHCFSGNQQMAQKCIDLGFYISFAGTITFSNARRLHKIAKWIDLRNVILETDCPWLAPQDMRGRRNEPSFIAFTAKKVAELKGVTVAEVARVTTKNAREIFELP